MEADDVMNRSVNSDVRINTRDSAANHRALGVWRVIVVVLVGMMLGAPAFALTPATLVRPELDDQAISITSLRQGVLGYFDQQRRLQREQVNQFVQLRDIGGQQPRITENAQVIELVDGQRLVGKWVNASAAGEAVIWQHPIIGDVSLQLEQIARITLAGSFEPGRWDMLSEDRVVLTNGDTMTGFIESVASESLTLTPDGSAEAIALPLGRIGSVALANPAQQPTAGHQLVTLSDGSRLIVASVQIVGDRVELDAPLSSSDSPVVLPLDQLAQIDFTASGYRLVELTQYPMQVSGGEVFGLTLEPRVQGEDILMHAPVKVTFELPTTAQRFAGDAQLDTRDDAPPQMLDWADFELLVHHGEPSPHRLRLRGDQPSGRINLPITDATLVLELEPGVNGPILDRLRLRGGVILINDPDAASHSEHP